MRLRCVLCCELIQVGNGRILHTNYGTCIIDRYDGFIEGIHVFPKYIDVKMHKDFLPLCIFPHTEPTFPDWKFVSKKWRV